MLQPIWTADPPRPVPGDAAGTRCGSGSSARTRSTCRAASSRTCSDLAAALSALGHDGRACSRPADDGHAALPEFVTPRRPRDRACPYNGSVARVTFGPVAYARVRRWLAEHEFDVLHLHEPTTFSLSALALFAAEGPIVATFHTSTERSRALRAFGGVIAAADGEGDGADRGVPDRRGGCRSSTSAATRWRSRTASTSPRSPTARCCRATRGRATRSGSSAGSTSRARACRCCSTRCARSRRDAARTCGCSSSGRGDAGGAAPAGRARSWPTGSTCSAPSTTPTKAAALRSMDVFCAPNTRRRELRDGAGRGDGRRRAGAGQRPRRVPRRARRRRPGALFRDRRRRRRWPPRSAALLDDPARRAALAAPGGRGRPRSTGRWSPRAVRAGLPRRDRRRSPPRRPGRTRERAAGDAPTSALRCPR